MLRIFFSAEDIARTRVAPAADPVWELVLSLHLLRGRTRDPIMAGWREEVHGRLRRTASEPLRLLFAINPPKGYFPDFLTPYQSLHGLEAGLDAVRSTPVPLLYRDLNMLAEQAPLPSPAPALARGEPEVLWQLTDSMRQYQKVAIAPYWSHIQAAVQADRVVRARAFLDGGAEGLLDSMRPAIRWQSGVLEVVDYPASRNLYLGGRGLLLVPAFFCTSTPVALLDPGLPPVLVYPVDRLGGLAAGSMTGQPTAGSRDRAHKALSALLGRTRAAVLEAVDDGCSTGELARRLGISPAAASQHTTVLRNAGLLVSRRERNTVLHALTPLGQTLLGNGGRPGEQVTRAVPAQG